MSRIKKIFFTGTIVLSFLLPWAYYADALKAPHNSTRAIGCSSCHFPKSAKFLTITSNQGMCFSQQWGCHNVFKTGTSSAGKKRLSRLNASNRFNTLTAIPGATQSSHGWKIKNENPNAGATNWNSGQPFSFLNSKIFCSRCHMAHGEHPAGGFLRASKKGDNICLQCHTKRRIGPVTNSNVRDPRPAGLDYSHPVEVNYSSVAAAKPTFFETTPQLAAGYNESARPRLYTTIDGLKGAVVCSTCHGPLHAADSNPYTFDSLSSYSRTGQYSTSAGNLLRQYPMSRSNNICTACHKVQTHMTYSLCADCHVPHKKAGDNNIYLIRTSITTPWGPRSVYFTSTTQMAKRYNIYSGVGTDKTQRSTAVCQVCHSQRSHHRAYSTLGADRTHNLRNPADWTQGYKFCPECHKHTSASAGGGFKPEGCNGCHNDPPTIGKHAKHVGDSSGYSTWKWNEGIMYDQRSASSYGFSCGRCHSPWVPYTAGVNSSNKYEGKNHYGVGTPSATKVYTSDIGFKNGSPLPQNPSGSYTYGGVGTVDRPYSVNFRTPATGTCSNLYCHGQFYGGYTSNNPDFTGTQSCVGKCHGTNAANLPGVNGTGEWGAHRRHIGGVQYAQYGFGTPNFRCNACHNATASQNNETTITSRIYHVNGKVNVRFDPLYGTSASTYNGLNDYSGATNINLGSKTPYKACSKVYCHSDGSRLQGNYSSSSSSGNTLAVLPNWSSTKNFTSFGGTSTKRRCARCHGSSYSGITAAMPGYSRPGKGNSHAKHVIVNGFMCRVCHSLTVGTDNRSIADTTRHVNRQYNIDILASYGGSYDGASGTCSNVKCHGTRTTRPWGTSSANNCKDCHFSSTGDVEGFADNYRFRNFTVTASTPKIYSTEWAGRGHGSSYASKICTDCHKQSGNISHKSEVSSNAFRVFTAPTHIDDLCLECHTNDAARSKYGQATKRDIQTHFSSGWNGWGDARWSFRPKCIDCHDPHGDRNRSMIHTYINYSGSDGTGKRNYDQNPSAQMQFSTVGGGLMNWSSFVNPGFTGLCQRCHNTQGNLDHFNKANKYDTTHNPKNACTGCHKHSTGFKGMSCNGCHTFPPTLSGKHSFHVATTVSMTHVAYDVRSTKTKYAFGCGKCHDTTQHYAGFGVFTADLNFDSSNSLPRNGNASYAFGARSSLDRGAFGNETSKFRWVSTKGTCKNLYCHGQFFGGYSGNNPTWYGSQPCGSCHGASQSNPPSTNGVPSGAHAKHVTTYAFKCRFCHRDTTGGFDAYTVANRSYHVNGVTDIRLYTTESRIRGNARYGNAGSEYINVTTNNNPGSAPNYRYCKNIYCHSAGTDFSSFALPNYTAKWGQKLNNDFPNAGERCSYCHGSKKTAGGYAGITSAMPNYPSGAKLNSHKKHVVDNGFGCAACHAKTVKGFGTISSINFHVNKVYDIYFQSKYDAGSASYSSSTNKCSNIKCHGGRTTPAWGSGAVCQDCHYQNAGQTDVDNFTFNNFSGPVAKIYSTEWAKRGHGKTKSSGDYAFSNNSGAGKGCTDCHSPAIKHGNTSNPFRLITSGGNSGANPDVFCSRCHGTASQLKTGFGRITGILTHSYSNLSTYGQYKGGTNGKAGWNFTPKCVDCHDPHGDKNNYMVHTYINMTGSDQYGRPTASQPQDTNLMNFTAVGGPQMNWSSYVRADYKGICQRCHTNQSEMVNFNKGTYSNHNRTQRCSNCHKHKKGFAPSGCDSCHGYPPPPAPTTLGWKSYADELSNVSSLHVPHAWNRRQRPGIPTTENDVDTVGGKGSNEKGYKCYKCHDGAVDSNGQSPTHGAGAPSKKNASMKNMTMLYGKWSPGAMSGYSSVTDDTCSKVTCHTPRAYTRSWKKPTDCNGCHGYQSKTAITGYNLHTTEVHKIHVGYTTAGLDKKKYGFACKRCHYDNANNYSTHYNGMVNFTTGGNFVATGSYGRGKAFKGITTRNELTATSSACSKIYCHGNFTNGTTTDVPKWRKGLMTTTCTSCHKGKLTGGDGSLMPERHPKHVSTYSFACAKCHARTTNNITTVIFNYSSHVNGRKDTYFAGGAPYWNNNGVFDSNRKCKNIYCHSSGAIARSSAGSFTTRTTLYNYTADWNVVPSNVCSLCHGNKTYKGITAAMPNYTSTWGNSHRTHVIGNNFKCYVCHAATVSAGGSIVSYSNHVNGFKNISIIAAYKSGLTLYSTNATATKKMTCKNVKCHAGNVTPKWGTYANCMDCHKSTSGDTDKRVSINNSFQSFSETAAKIYSTAWGTKGHGAQGRGCTNCHGSGETRGVGGNVATKHGTGTNPFRLFTAPTRPNVLCESCHGTNATNPAKGNKTNIQTHSSSVTATGRHNYAIKCVDCHDPHGDNNVMMLHSSVARPLITGTRAESSNLYGQRLANVTSSNVDFVNRQYTSDYARRFKAPKVCQVCHTRTYDPIAADPKPGRFRWYSSGDKSHGGAKCTNCHSHGTGFKGAKCDACHGYPPTGAFNLISSTGRVNEIRTPRSSSSTTAGAHGRHTSIFLPGAGGDLNTVCNYCHNGGMAATGNEDDDITLKFSAFTQYTGGKYRGQAAVQSGFYGYSGAGAGSPNAAGLRCESVKCHGGGGWLTKSLGNITSPRWNDTSRNSVYCGSCHGAKRKAGQDTWPTTKAHATHVSFGTGKYDFMCKLCHNATVLTSATTLSKTNHVNGQVIVQLDTADVRVDTLSRYTTGDTKVNSGFGKCINTYCHSQGNRTSGWVGQTDANPVFNASWTTIRGGYKKSTGSVAKCNFCHGNTSWTGITSAMPGYLDNSPKANKHSKHVKTYGFMCGECHNQVTNNNTSIDVAGGTGLNGRHINKVYNVDFANGTRTVIYNQQGRYTSTGSWCRNTYCHSRGTKGPNAAPYTNTTALSNYSAKWGANMNTGGYKTGMRCKYCHGNRAYTGMTAAMPNYANTAAKANRHPKHVVTYGFTCTACHAKVTSNNTSIDASGGSDLHVNGGYNVNFNKNVPSFADNTGLFVTSGSRCRNTYCHSRGTDFAKPYNTRTSFANFTASWGDNLGGYRQTAGNKAKCNYCHGNRLYSGMTSAMPNYSTQIKPNSHKKHVVGYGFVCKACHKYVTNNNSSIDAAGGTSKHANKSYNVDFSNSFNNNTGAYWFIGVGSKNRCKNTYCHSRGTKLAKPFNTRTSFSNFTAMWGDILGSGSYMQTKGAKAKCNYCHGNRAYSGTTSAMPNYSGNVGARTAKANSHRIHVITNGIQCKTCHNNIAMNNTSISDRSRHVNGFYNISIFGYRGAGQKVYSMVYDGSGGTCMNNTCHGAGKPKWGGVVICFDCHAGTEQRAKPIKTVANGPNPVNFQEYTSKGHGRSTPFPVGGNSAPGKWNNATGKGCYRTDTPNGCHSASADHTTKDVNNPFRLYTAPDRPDMLCSSCHGVGGSGSNTVNILAHNKTNIGSVRNWPFTPKCVDCHDPHGDTNAFMLRAYQNSPTGATAGTGGSGKFGNVTGNGTATYGLLSSIVFNNEAGKADGSFASASKPGIGICENCHSSSATPTGIVWYNQEGASNASTHSSNTGACTGCHKHDAAFKGGGESSGNQECSGCHSNIFNPMSSNRSYHHVMQNTSATGPNKYPIGNGINQTDARRRCLMCHVDHNVFRPDMNPTYSKGRGGNLRANIFTKATSNVASSFAKSDWLGTDPNGGICLSCHTVPQTKNTAKQINDGSTKTLRLFTTFYRNTPHNYTAVGVISSNGNKFNANCLKCHNDTMAKTKFKTNSGFGLHDSKLRRINSKLDQTIDYGSASAVGGTTLTDSSKAWTASDWATRVVTITSPGKVQTRIISNNTPTQLTVSATFSPALAIGDTYTIGDPVEEDLCFHCHSLKTNPNGANGRDYYNMVDFVNSKALKMEQTFTGDSGTADSGTTTTVTDAKVWQTNQWANYLLKITAGTNGGQERTIASNTATTLTISGTAFKKAIDTTSVYAIGNPFRHRIDNFGGVHKSDEATSTPGTATTTGWFSDTGTGTHVGCTDCHNPHSQRKPGVAQGRSLNTNAYCTTTSIFDNGAVGGTKSWTTNQWRGYLMVAVDRSQSGEERMILSNTANTFRVNAAFSARMTGVYYNILPKGRAYVATSNPTQVGNALNGPNNGQWGIKVTKWDSPGVNTTTAEFNNMSSPTFAKVTTLYSMQDKTYQLCFKCHSKYGWGTSGTPFRAMDTGLSTMGVYTAGKTTDISAEVNPNNLAHHALVLPGENQPILANYGDAAKSSVHNPNWPYYSTAGGTDYLNVAVGGAATLSGAAKLPDTAIPGWFIWVGASDVPPSTPTAGTGTTGWFQITEISSPTSFKVTPTAYTVTNGVNWAISAGLGNNFVPPYGPWSVINCADCHDTDASNDPSGPHGSGRNWILRKMESQTFKWMNSIGSGPTYLTVGWTNQGWVSAYAPNILCLNCHRADVYGADGNQPNGGALPTTTDGGYQNFAFRATLSRQPHSPESTVNAYGAPSGTTDGALGNTFRIVCLHCHAGDGLGSIHGTNKGASLDNSGVVVASGRAYRGKRFLVGSSWNGLIRSTTAAAGTCTQNGRSTEDNINTCNRSEEKAMANVATYNYENATDY